jgi:hypothetical protein
MQAGSLLVVWAAGKMLTGSTASVSPTEANRYHVWKHRSNPAWKVRLPETNFCNLWDSGFGIKCDGITGNEKKSAYTEQVHDFYNLTYIIRVIKSRIIKWVGHLVGNRQKTPWKF